MLYLLGAITLGSLSWETGFDIAMADLKQKYTITIAIASRKESPKNFVLKCTVQLNRLWRLKLG